MADQSTEFDGEILVASRIVDYLSSGLYATPAACIKELINNSYDADATDVKVFVKPEADRIIIEDNGTGMSKSEFETHFRRLAESHKRDDGDTTGSGRPKIGKIGIGFIAANEICDLLEIESTKEGSTELLRVTIDFSKMREDPEARKRDDTDLAKADYHGLIDVAEFDNHFTNLYLLKIRPEARRVFSGIERIAGPDTKLSLYGLKEISVENILGSPDAPSWDKFDAYSETMLRVALNVPVQYHNRVCKSAEQMAQLEQFIEKTKALNFNVKYDGADLRKPILFRGDSDRSFVKPFKFSGELVGAEGYFYAQSGVLKPRDLNGLLIRIRNSAVGEYDRSFLNYPSESGTLFQRWISCELWASDGLEEALNIDRRTLRPTHDAVVELRENFHKELSAVIMTVRKELHGKSSQLRKDDTIAAQTTALKAIVRTMRNQDSSPAVDALEGLISKNTYSSGLSRKYSSAEFFRMVERALTDTHVDSELKFQILNRLLELLLRP